MTGKSRGQELLENAYELQSPADSVRYYGRFAATYDTDFAQAMGYRYPSAIAEAYRASATADDLPVADIGCGTGLVAAELGLPPDLIDGMDISAQMLAEAGRKARYRSLYRVDLTADLSEVGNGYGAVLSAGTFTHGHLGPQPLRALLTISRPGALFVIGVNRMHFVEAGFASALKALVDGALIDSLRIDEAMIYDKPGHVHSDDRALVLRYRRSASD